MKKLSIIILRTVLALVLFSFAQVLVFKWLPVSVTPLMIIRSVENRHDKDFHTTKKWRSIRKISPNMVKAVVASEDNLFPVHNGFDWEAVKKEVEKSRKSGKPARGCSTISQQTAKNVFTLGDRSFLRKGVEAYYTLLIELIWGKKRIMEVYLNVAEMGPGIYGAEAAARAYYSKHASELNLQESALITACLPSPLKRSPLKPTDYLRRRQRQIVSLVPKLDFSFLEEW